MTSKANISGEIFDYKKRAARTILDIKTKEERTISLFKKLDWMPFYDEIFMKFYDEIYVNCVIFKYLNGQCPEYLLNKLVRVSDTSARSSRYVHMATLPQVHQCNRRVNSLPVNTRSSENINAFKHKYIKYVKER